MPIYSVDYNICGTMYVRAKNAKEANKIAASYKQDGLEFSTKGGCYPHEEIEISGRQFDDPDLPDVSLSPAMTLIGPCGKVERAD